MASSCSNKLLVLLRELTAEHYDDFHCLNCLHSFRTKNKLESHKKVFENKDFCKLIMPSEDIKILKLNQYQKSGNALFIIYTDRQWIIEKIDECKNIPESFSTLKVSEHILSAFSMSTISSFKSIENKHNVIEVKIA